MNEVAHWFVTAGLGLLSLILSALGVVLWTNLRDVKHATDSLQHQNEAQERELAGLKATQVSHDGGFETVRRALERMDSKIDQLMIAIGRRPTPFGSGHGSSER